jgi:ATP synthase subunit 6
MLPFGYTITAHFIVTFFLSFIINLGLIIYGFYLHKFNFLKLFDPEGTPSLLRPLIIVIEVISYLIRTFSLSIRLFANMMAGHCLLFVISSFAIICLSKFSIIMFIPFIFIYIAIFILEFCIAFLQAYVFTILVCIYLKDSLQPNH